MLQLVSPLEGTSKIASKAPTCICRFKTWNIYGIVGFFIFMSVGENMDTQRIVMLIGEEALAQLTKARVAVLGL